ncbi:hypothetical protein TWF718_002194 [Orbilia javanica]|uniref:Uncharacterized protein n=1 Tax=Orbilia javanica TaxID=47235 RepID=A0AAN8MJQ0_9PEZI
MSFVEITENDTDPESASSDGGSTIRQPSSTTARVLSKAIQDFETDFNAWDSSYKLHRLPSVYSRPYTPTPYSTFPTYPPSAFSHTSPTASVGSLYSANTNTAAILLHNTGIGGGRAKEQVQRLGGVYAYNPHFEPGTKFPRRMSRVAVVEDIRFGSSTGSRTLVGSSGDIASVSRNREREVGIGCLAKLKREILTKAKGRREDQEGLAYVLIGAKMDKWDYPGIDSEEKSKIPTVQSSAIGGDDETDGGSESTLGGGIAASASGEVGISSHAPTLEPSSQTTEASGSKYRNIQNIPSNSGSSKDTLSEIKTEPPENKEESLSSGRKTQPPIIGDTVDQPHAPKALLSQIPLIYPSLSSLKRRLEDISTLYPEGAPSSLAQDDGGLIQEERKKPKGQVRFGSVDIRVFRSPGGPYGSPRSKRWERGAKSERGSSPSRSSSPSTSSYGTKKPASQIRRNTESLRSSSAPPPSSLARRPSPTRKRRSNRPSPSVSPSPRGRKRREDDLPSIRYMSPPQRRPHGGDPESSRSCAKYTGFSKWKMKSREEHPPPMHNPPEAHGALAKKDSRQETIREAPQDAKAGRAETIVQEILELTHPEARILQGNFSRERDIEAVMMHEEEERGRTMHTGTDACQSGSGSQLLRRLSVDSRSISPCIEIQGIDMAVHSPRGSAEGSSGTTQEQLHALEQSEGGQPREDSTGGPREEGETPQAPQEPGSPPKSREENPKDEPPKKPSLIDRLFARYCVHVPEARKGKLTKEDDSYGAAKARELDAISPQQKRRLKLLQIKRRLSQFGMLATVVTSIYLICFGIAWQEHHRWNDYKEGRPSDTSPFAVWCVCMVWICMAALLNSLAMRTIIDLWIFGRRYPKWHHSQRKWQLFSKAGLVISFIIGGATIAAFAGTVAMLREARMLEIERGYWVHSHEGESGVGG